MATMATDTQAYGDYYQWGRLYDGHQASSSASTFATSTGDVPGNSLFIKNATTTFDWRNPKNDLLWQGVSGINNPCPSGFRLPTSTEWVYYTYKAGITDINGSNRTCGSDCLNAFANTKLKLPVAGYRGNSSAALGSQGSNGYYWSSSPGSASAYDLYFDASSVSLAGSDSRAYGFSVRCVED